MRSPELEQIQGLATLIVGEDVFLRTGTVLEELRYQTRVGGGSPLRDREPLASLSELRDMILVSGAAGDWVIVH
jgi:hypothetical protein